MLNQSFSHDWMVAEGVKLLSNRQFYQHDDTETWFGHWDKFGQIDPSKNNALLKVIWCTRIARRKPQYNVREYEILDLAKKCEDFCPVNETPLDYGVNFNRVVNPNNPGCEHHTLYVPSIDHIIAKSKFKKYGGYLDGDPDCIENYKIVSFDANKIKNDKFSTEEELDRWYRNMKKTYWPKKVDNV